MNLYFRFKLPYFRYEPGTDGEDQTIFRKLNIDPDSVPDENVTEIIEEAALAMNATELLNHTTVEQQVRKNIILFNL